MTTRPPSRTPGQPYQRAAEGIRAGESRCFGELAAAAGRHGAARAAGRAIAQMATDSRLPWHRVVASDGSLARDEERAAAQLRRLRREGARPRKTENIAAWAHRRGLECVGHYPTKRYLAADDPRLVRWQPERVEGFASEADALARRFLHVDAAPAEPIGLPPATPRVERRGVQARSSRSLPGVGRRLAALDWKALGSSLLERGFAHCPGLLRGGECERLLAAGSDPRRFHRSTDMEPRGYGVGSYHYWREPLPEPARELRAELYRRSLPIARLFVPRAIQLPETLAAFWKACRAAGQRRPSSILIGYGSGGINHAHRDLYGEQAFPLQALVVLSRRRKDFEGGDFLLMREESDGRLARGAVPADRGDLVLFASSRLPATPQRRSVPVLHGMQTLTRGRRYALGLVFHLAE